MSYYWDIVLDIFISQLQECFTNKWVNWDTDTLLNKLCYKSIGHKRHENVHIAIRIGMKDNQEVLSQYCGRCCHVTVAPMHQQSQFWPPLSLHCQEIPALDGLGPPTSLYWWVHIVLGKLLGLMTRVAQTQGIARTTAGINVCTKMVWRRYVCYTFSTRLCSTQMVNAIS